MGIWRLETSSEDKITVVDSGLDFFGDVLLTKQAPAISCVLVILSEKGISTPHFYVGKNKSIRPAATDTTADAAQ